MATIDKSLPVRFAADLPECDLCGEPWCPECKMHYADCPHPGPHSEEDGDETSVLAGDLDAGFDYGVVCDATRCLGPTPDGSDDSSVDNPDDV